MSILETETCSFILFVNIIIRRVSSKWAPTPMTSQRWHLHKPTRFKGKCSKDM